MVLRYVTSSPQWFDLRSTWFLNFFTQNSNGRLILLVISLRKTILRNEVSKHDTTLSFVAWVYPQNDTSFPLMQMKNQALRLVNTCLPLTLRSKFFPEHYFFADLPTSYGPPSYMINPMPSRIPEKHWIGGIKSRNTFETNKRCILYFYTQNKLYCLYF